MRTTKPSSLNVTSSASVRRMATFDYRGLWQSVRNGCSSDVRNGCSTRSRKCPGKRIESRVQKLQDARGVVGKVEVFVGGLAQFLAIPTTVTAPFLRGPEIFDRFFTVFSRAPL